MDSRGIEPRTTPRIEFEARCACEMLREYYTTKPRARGVVELLLLWWRLGRIVVILLSLFVGRALGHLLCTKLQRALWECCLSLLLFLILPSKMKILDRRCLLCLKNHTWDAIKLAYSVLKIRITAMYAVSFPPGCIWIFTLQHLRLMRSLKARWACYLPHSKS